MNFRPLPTPTDGGGDGGTTEGWPTFVQDTAPTTSITKYVWINTAEDPPQVFVEDAS